MMADHPAPCVRQKLDGDCELERLADQYHATETPYPHRAVTRGQDDSSPIILVDHAACILCDRCVRACADLRDNFVIARQGKGYNAGIAFDLGKPMGSSSCVSCGECMYSCPTGALTNKVSVDHAFEVGTPCETHELLALPIFEHVSGNFLNFNKGAGKGRRMTSTLVDKHKHRHHEEHLQRTYVPVDSGVELSLDQPEKQLHPGALFGEMSCLNAYPHSSTARAATDCVVLEMRRNVVDMLRRSKTFREKIDEDYLTHTFENHLRSSHVFAPLAKHFIQALRPKLRLLRYAPGEVIYKQGELADGFYLVRRGFVKVTESYPGGDLVLAYLPAGSHFGEMSLLSDGKHMATCSALDHVDLVRIDGDDFKEMLNIYPAVREDLKKIREERIRENRRRFTEYSDVHVDEFLRQGLMEATNLLVLDLDKCTRCDQCVKACADAHDGVTRLVRDGLRVENFLVATSCRHCQDPLCMVCPVGAIRRRPG